MNRLAKLVRAVAVAATFLALPLAAQTDSVYTDDFQSYGTQKNPPGWIDTAIGSSTPVAGGLYKTWPDPTQGNKGTNIVFGSKSASGKADPSTNPRIGHFSTYTTKTFAGSGRFEFSGRFIRTNTDSRIGLTFFSSYPEKDSYYLIGLWAQPSGKLTMQLYAFGGAVPTGTLDSNFTPDPNKWYRFLISADDSNGKTAIHAKFWLDTNPEPSAWNIDATDTSAGRLTSGRIGIWAAVRGENYVDDLAAKSPVDHTAPVIKVLESGQPLAEGTRFNRAPSPEIVVTDDLTPAAQIVVTAQLDGQPFTSKTAVTGQGNHTLTVHAVDTVGNASDLTVHFYVDTIPPAVTVISPKDGSMTANDVTIALQVVDASLPYKVAATLDGAAFDITKPVTSEGKHTLAMTVTDDVGLSTVVPPVTFTIDKSDPQYVLKEGSNPFPASGFVFDRDVTAHVDATDLTPVTVKLTLDGASYVENTPITVEGDHTIAGTVADSVGHVVTIPPRAFTIDKSAPVVTITENDVPMVTYYDRAVKPVIKVTDFSNYTVAATIDGQPFTFGTTLSAEKKYTLAGTVTDAANHSTPFGPIVFYVDLSAPVVQLTANGNPFPAAGFVFDADVAANATITDLTPAKSAVTLDGQTVTLPLTISDEKPHKLTAVVTDSVNKSTTATADFVIDKTPPSVDVQESGTSLQDGRYFNRAVTPQIVVTDSTATTVAATLDGQPFTSGTAISAEGKHTIAGSVTDAAQHKVDIGPVSFFIDTTKPVGVFKEGDADFPDGKSLNRDVTAHVVVTDASPVTVTILLDGSPYVENTPITTEQSHTLSATLLDKAGNSNTVPPVTFRIDRTPPAVVLLANGSAFPSDYVFGKDIAADVRVDDASTTTTKGTLDGNQITFPFTITAEGQHTISATSTDAAGLATTTPTIHFTLDKTPPTVTVLENGVEAVPNKVFGVDVTVTFTIDQGVSGRTAYPTLDGNPYVAGTAITAEGVHTIAGEVKSAAGLSTPIPQTVFTIDKTKPVVKLLNRDKDFPPSGFYFNSDVVPVVNCTDNLTHCTAKLVLNGAEVPNNTPITAEGAYTLAVSGRDEAGNETDLDPVTFTIDKTPPAVTVTSHTSGQIVTEPQAVIAGASDDAVTVTVNGVNADIDFNNHTYKTPSALPLLEGENIIAVTGTDRAGNPGTTSVRIVLDTRNPSLTVKAPAAGACITDAGLVVSGTVNDPNISKVSVTAGSATVDNALDATKQAFSATFPGIAEGTQNIVVVATDSQGHRTQAQLSVFVDRGTPVIDVLESNAPFTAKVVNHPVALTLRVTDRDPNVALSATLDGTSSYVSGAIIGGEGAHRVDVVAADCAGHQAAVSIQFTIDTTAPVITSVIPANGSTIAAAPQNITGTISGEAVKVEIAGTNISATPAADGDFTLTGATFREGANAFTLRATDAAGNSSTLAYSFAVKSQAPKVDIYESGSLLTDGRTFNRPVTPVVKSDDAEATITALLNGATYDGSPVRGDGNYTIEGRATDKLNHTGSATRTFTIDMTPPAVHITSPAPGDVPSTTVTVSGTAGDAVSVLVNNVPATLSNGNFSATVPLDIGENAIIAAATDAAGNTGQDRIIVNVLGSGPGIIITEPADASLTNRPRIDVAGRVLSPTSDGHVTIGSARAEVDAAGDFRFNGYQLTEGENVISVSATGTNLQTATAQIHVTADFTPPALTVLASDQALLDNAQFPQTVTITLRASDNRGAVTTTLSLDGSAQTAPVTVSANSGHVLTATARDTAGNETRIDRTFFIGSSTAGSQGCHIDSTDPVDGTVIGASSVKVAGRAPGAATVTVAGVNASVADSSFAASIDLPNEGSNTIQIQCADAGGLTATRTINLIRQTGNPSIDITLPTEGFPTADKTITVSGTISADVVSADVNGKAVTISGTTFTVAGISLANGLNTLVAHAKNQAGRTAADSVRVRSIQTAPDIAITSPLNDYQTGDTKVTVGGTWSNLDPQTLAISGQSGVAPQVSVTRLSDTTGSFTITGAGLASGVNTLTVTGRNVLNATATSSVKVTVAANTPSITIASPADNAYLPGDQPISVAGSFNATGAHIDINSNVATITDSSFSGSAAFSTAGDVTPVVARLSDGTGNSAYASISVHRLTAPFAVKEAFPAPDAQEVDPGVIVLVSFNAPVDMNTVAGAVTLKGSDGTTVTGTTLVDDTVLTFAPTALLKTGTTYTISVATSLKNAAGIALASAFSSSFTTASSAPATKPSIDPITTVDCAKPLLITGTAPAGARLRMDAATLTLTGSADANGKFSFTYPFNGQSGWQVARVRIVGADGSLSPADEVAFRFDCAAPQVVGSSYDRTVNTLTITFSKPVDPATLVVGSSGTIVITSNGGNTSGGTFTVSGSNVVVTPADDLRAATFTVTVTDGVKDAGGNKLVAPYSQTFSTSDDVPPAPGDGSGFISGEVYDASTGRPLTGADVTIIVPATAFAKAPGTDSRYTIIGGGAGQAVSLSSKKKVNSNSLQVAVNSATEGRGRYTLPLPEGAHTIQATRNGYTSVWRQIIVPAGAGVVPIDIRLTKRGDVKTSDGASPISLASGGDTVITRAVSATIPGGAVPSGSQAALTSVGAQSLAGLLPLGWSPLASAEVAVIDATGAVLPHATLGSNAQIVFTLPSSEVSAANQVLSLVQYDDDRDEWRVLVPVMTAGSNDKWSATITTSGAYAVVYPDKAAGLTPPPAAQGGATLQPAAGTCAPCELVKKSFVADPNPIVPNGHTVATLQISSGATTHFPSGTAVQAYINEELHLPGGTTLVDPPFATDVLLYRNLAGDTGFGQFRLEPSEQATRRVLSDGVDHIQILQYPGRLDRGTLIGAEGGRVPGDESVAVEIPSSATTVELHASVSSLAPADLATYGTIAGFKIIGGFSLTMSRAQAPSPQDLDGDGQPDAIPPVVLSRAARATVAIDTTQLPAPSSLVILAEVVDDAVWGRVIRLADPMSAIDAPQAGVTTIRYTTRSIDPAQLQVDGVVREGKYLILAANDPIAYATGAVRGGAGGAYLADARLTSFTQPSNSPLGVSDVTRNTGVFAIPVAATPAAGFALLPKHANTGEGAVINSTSAPAPDTIVKLGDVILTPQSPALVSTSPANGATVDVSAPLVITMNFSAPIDLATAKTAISVKNVTDGTLLSGAVNGSGATVTFSPVGALVAASRYVVSIQPTLRGTNGAALQSAAAFGFSTSTIPTNQNIDPLKVHITIPDNGVSRIWGEAGAIPGGWRVLPVRQVSDFITRYQSDVAADGSFSLLAGNGVDASDRITIEDVIDLRVINPAGNVAAVIRLTPFVTADGKGFIAPFGVTSTFKSVEGIVVTVPAGAFDEPTLVNVGMNANNAVFNDVPNVANELQLVRSINIKFDGVAKQRIEVSIPANGLPADHDYTLGWHGLSVWGPRIAIVDTLRLDGNNFTTAYPTDQQAKKIIAAANAAGGARVHSTAGLTDMTVKSCLVGVTRQGDYAMMDWTFPVPGGGLGWAIVSGIARQVDVMSDLFQAIYLPDFAFSSRNNCAAMPIIKEKPFTLTGVDPSTGIVQFKTSYDPIPAGGPPVVPISSPDPDNRGPYPIFGTPFRIETIDFTADKYEGRGYKLELDTSGKPHRIFLRSIATVPADQKIAEHAKIQIYDATTSRWSSDSTEVDAAGQFGESSVEGDRGDQLIVYISSSDVGVDQRMYVVFTEPIDAGPIASTSTTPDAQAHDVDVNLHKRIKIERIVNSSPAEVTKDATFSVDSQNRRIWISFPAPLIAGATYRMTFFGDLTHGSDQIKDPKGNVLGILKDNSGNIVGDVGRDLKLEFMVRDNYDKTLTSFQLQARPDFTSASEGLRDLAQSGNLAFASAIDAGILVYDLSDPNSLRKDKSGQQPYPYSLVPARWTVTDPATGLSHTLNGANGFDQYWAVATDQHNRVFGAGFQSTLSAVRIYNVEDFVKAHNDNNGDQCSGFISFSGADAAPDNLKVANCQFHGATIVGWRPGYEANMPLSSGLVMTDYPEAYPRKIQIATQDNTKKYDGLDVLDSSATKTSDKVEIEAKTELGDTAQTPHTDNWRFNVRIKAAVPITSSMSAADKAGYLVERITIVNTDLDLRWSVDKYLGEDAVITGVIGRKKDHFQILRNQLTYSIITMLGYGISVYDMRAVQSNDIGQSCGDAVFGAAHGDFCSIVVAGHPRLLEKILNTRGDGVCDGTATPAYDPAAIQNVTFSAESAGITPAEKDSSGNTVYTKLRMYGLDPRKGVLDLNYDLPTDGSQPVAKCATRPVKGLVFADVQRLNEVRSAVHGASPRYNAQSLFHWEISAAGNVRGERGSEPNKAASRDYSLIAAGVYGMLVVEINGNPAPPNGPASYFPLEQGHLADIVWFASGCYAIRPIPKTNLVTVLDGKGHVLIVDMSKIDQRWVDPNPNLATGGAAPMIGEFDPFPITHTAISGTPVNSDEIGVDDARVIYKSPYVYTTGVLAPLVDPDTGIAFGGDSITHNMRVAELFDPPMEVLADLGNGKLEPVTGIVPLGVQPPPKDATKKPADPDYNYPKGALAAFKVRVTLPGSISKAMQNSQLQFAVESESFPNELTAQTPIGTPPAHLRHNKRDGAEETRKVDLVFKHESDLDPSSATYDADFRHQAGYNRLVSPWIVAIADPRASEHVQGDSAAKKKLGCMSCDRPDALHGVDEDHGVYELFTNGRTITVRPDADKDSTKEKDALNGLDTVNGHQYDNVNGTTSPSIYFYLADKGRLELHVPTTMADTVRGEDLTVSAQAPPVADGAISETMYVHSGEIEVNSTDLLIPGRAGNDVAVSRTHRSRTLGTTPLGAGWEAPFLRRLRQLPTGNVEYRDGSGEIWTFTPITTVSTTAATASATSAIEQQFGLRIRYNSPKGLYLELARSDNGWILFDRQWRIARFDNYGRLTSISDEFWKDPPPVGSTPPPGPGAAPPTGELGNSTFYVYDHTGRLTEIVDSLGRKTELTYWKKPAPSDPAPVEKYDCTALGVRTVPCAYDGLLATITDWRSRQVMFEYDKYARLIGVQRPLVQGPDAAGFNASTINATTNFSAANTRPRVSYTYESPTAPAVSEPLQSLTYTNYMYLNGKLHELFDAAQNQPGVTSPKARVSFDYYDIFTTPETYDRLHFQHWPCGNYDGSTCGETEATFEYSGDTTTVTDMLGQKRDYQVADLKAPVVPPATEPDPQKDKFRHVIKETVYDVPTIDKTPTDTLGVNDPAPGKPFVTTFVPAGITAPYYDAFDDEGGVRDMTLPNGLTVHYDTEKAHNGAAGLILDKITEQSGSDKRVTKYTYDNNHPNAANTVIRVGRSKDGTTFVERDAQSPSRELKNTQSRDVDQKVKTKVETNYDDYGRPTSVERRQESGSSLNFPTSAGSGLVVEQHKIDYFDDPNDADLKKGRAKEVHSDDPGGSSTSALDTTITYDSLPNGGQKITSVDQRRNVTTETDHDSQDRVIHEKVYDANTLSETWTGYDASGRVVYTAHSQAPAYERVESFIKYDAVGRAFEVRTTNNKVFGSDQDVTVKKQYSVSSHTTTTFDPSTSVGTPQAKTVITVDDLGRTLSSERQMLIVPALPAVQQTEISKFGYDSTGLLAYTTDTVRSAGFSMHDAFGRPSVSFGIDKMQVKSAYDEWDQVIEQEIVGTAGTSLSHAKQKFSHAGHLISRNEQVDSTGLTSNLRFRQTFNIWEDGGKKTGVRHGPATGLDTDLVGPHIRATEHENDATGRALSETYGGASGIDPGIAPALHKRTFENYIGNVPQKTTDISPLRSNASVVTNVVVDGLGRVHSSTVGNAYTTTTDYDLAGNVATVTPPQGIGTIHRDYDGRGLPFHEKRNSDDVTNTYDERGALRSYQDETGASNTTNYDVDPLGRVVKVTYPDSTTEEFKYEDKTGLTLAHKDRKNVWLSYVYDEGGRTTQIRKGEDPTSGASVLMTRFEYDGDSKRLTRVANKDAAIEFRKYDDLGRPGETVTYRYSGGTGLQADPIARTVLDVHIQGHAWSVFDGERLAWRFPVTGDAVGALNAAPWLTEITENRDESTNIISQLGASGTITESTPSGVGQLFDRFRTIGSQAIRSQYGYADTFIAAALGDPSEPQFGALRRVETGIASGSGSSMTTGPAIAGSEVFHDQTARIGQINDLGLTGRKSKYGYDSRGRILTSKLLVPQSALGTITPVTDQHNPATFHNERETAGSLILNDIKKLGVPMSLQAEPAKWVAAEGSAHEIQSKTLYLDGLAVPPDLTTPDPSAPSAVPTFTFAYEGGRRTSDGTWNSTFDEFGRMTAIENGDRRIEYVYDPHGRIVGRNAYEKPVGGGAPVIETRATALVGDGLPAQTTWVWDPIVDRLVAVYEAGKSTAAGATPEAGLVRQYLHGDRGYDDPVEVLVAKQAGATPEKYFPIFDEAGAGSLQAVLDANGNVVERVLYGDSYGDAPHYLQGPAVDKITFTPNSDGSVDVRVHANERVKEMTVASGVSLVALKSDDSVAATSTANASLDSDEVTIHWHLSGTEWTALTSSGAVKLQVAVKSSLRTYAWGDTPFSAVPDFARTLYTAKSDASNAVIVTSLLSTLASVPTATEEPLYEIKSLYMAGFDYSKTKLLTGFHALPFNEPANGLIFARARWYDPSTGSFLTPDPEGYHDASSLYAYASGDPVNGRDPSGKDCLGIALKSGEDYSCSDAFRWMMKDLKQQLFGSWPGTGIKEVDKKVRSGAEKTLDIAFKPMEWVANTGNSTGEVLDRMEWSLFQGGPAFGSREDDMWLAFGVAGDVMMFLAPFDMLEGEAPVSFRRAPAEVPEPVPAGQPKVTPAPDPDIVPLPVEANTGRLTYYHQLKTGKTTNVIELEEQINGQLQRMNEIIQKEGMEGLQNRILKYRSDPSIEAAGRAHAKSLGPAGVDANGDPFAWLHEPDMATGGSPTDITRKGLARNNSILGGQANRIADEILAMPKTTQNLKANLVMKVPRVKVAP